MKTTFERLVTEKYCVKEWDAMMACDGPPPFVPAQSHCTPVLRFIPEKDQTCIKIYSSPLTDCAKRHEQAPMKEYERHYSMLHRAVHLE